MIAILAVAGFARVTNAQTAQTQKVYLPTSMNAQVSNDVLPMSFDAVKSITQGSVREFVGEQLGTMNQSAIQSKINAEYEKLASGQPVSFGASIAGLAAHSVTEQHAMHVSLKYDARPIGGILTIRVELVPVFSGIGAASRPTALKTITQAVDRLDEESLGTIVSGLIHQMGSDYAAK